MYAISRVYREQEMPTPFPQNQATLLPSTRVQLRPVPPKPRRAPQPPVLDQKMHPWMCGCEACQPTIQIQQRVPRSTRGEYRGGVHKPSPLQTAVPEPEQDLHTVLVSTILRKLRRSIEAHPFIWLGVSYALNLF